VVPDLPDQPERQVDVGLFDVFIGNEARMPANYLHVKILVGSRNNI
jgi:hypothetical protein